MIERLVIIGGGAAGMSAASAARRVDPNLEVVVLEATGFAAYGLCGLPYYVAGVVSRAEDLVAYSPEFFQQRRRIDLRLHAEAATLDAEGHVIHYRWQGRPEQLTYDRLVVAAGGSPTVPPAPGLDNERVFTMRTLEDGIALRALLDAGHITRALIVGAGYIGLEMAEAFVTRGLDVVVVEQLPRVMPNLDEHLAEVVEDEVRGHGVDLRLGSALSEVKSGGAWMQAIVDGEPLSVDVVVIAAGLRPAAALATAAGAEMGPGGGLIVDERMCTTLPDVLAAGDCIAPHHLVLGRPSFVPLGPAANKTGRVAGTVAAGGDAAFRGIVGTAVVKVFDLAVARTGLTLAEAKAAGLPATATDAVGKSRAKYYPGSASINVRLVHEESGRLLGAQMIGRDGVAKRIDVVAAALHAGFDVDDLAALDLSYAPPYAPVYEPILLAAQSAALLGKRLRPVVPRSLSRGVPHG